MEVETANVRQAPGLRARRAAERRMAIIEAALGLFSERGFAATRIEDVAARAGVAKGTVYVHFADKQALFEGIVRTGVGQRIAGMAQLDVAALTSVRDLIEAVAIPLVLDLAESRYAAIPRLLIAEGGRFPALAAFYHHEIIEPGQAMIRRLLLRAVETGELADQEVARFPQLLVAPVLVGVVWKGLFEAMAPLDMEAMLRTWVDLVFRPGPAPS